jgi:hypothetical protein
MKRAAGALLRSHRRTFPRVALIGVRAARRRCSAPSGRSGSTSIVIMNDRAPRIYDERLVGVPFSWL